MLYVCKGLWECRILLYINCWPSRQEHFSLEVPEGHLVDRDIYDTSIYGFVKKKPGIKHTIYFKGWLENIILL